MNKNLKTYFETLDKLAFYGGGGLGMPQGAAGSPDPLGIKNLGSHPLSPTNPYVGSNVVESAKNYAYNVPGSIANAPAHIGNAVGKISNKVLGTSFGSFKPPVPLAKPDFRAGSTGLNTTTNPTTGVKSVTPSTVKDNAPNRVDPPSTGTAPAQINKITGATPPVAAAPKVNVEQKPTTPIQVGGGSVDQAAMQRFQKETGTAYNPKSVLDHYNMTQLLANKGTVSTKEWKGLGAPKVTAPQVAA